MRKRLASTSGGILVAATAILHLPGSNASSSELLLEDDFKKGKIGQPATTAGWKLDNARGNSQWTIGAEGTLRVLHAKKPYSQDSISRKLKLPPRFYMDFEAKFAEHAGLSLVAAAGRAGTSFHGSGKVVLWKVVPQRGRGWRTVPKAVIVGGWHRFRILVDADRSVQEFYIDDMTKPAFREEGLDLRIRREGKNPPRHVVEFRDYGLVQQPVESQVRSVKVFSLKPDEKPPANSLKVAEEHDAGGPTPAQIWQRPGRGRGPHPKQPVVVGPDVELFVDDYLIDTAENVRRRLNKPVPLKKNPVLVGDKPWEAGHLAFPSVRYIDGEFRMWYLAWGLNRPARAGKVPMADSTFLCYATSTDGIRWSKPKLGHIEFRGSRDNNIVLRHEGSHFDSFSVFYHPGEVDPFKMLAYQGRWPYKESLIKAKGYQFRIKQHGHYPFRSSDGIHWEYIQDEPKQVWGWDRSSAGYDTRRKKYLGFWKTGYKGVRSRMYAESDDLVHWTKATKSLTPEWIDDPNSKVDPPGTHFYGMFAFNYGSGYLGLLEILNDLTARMHFQLISSRDLKTWNRLSAPQRFIDHGKPGSWNSGIQMMANTPPVLFQHRLFFYYDGANYDHSRIVGEKQRAIGISTLPKDRFAAVFADDKSQEAILTSVPVRLSGKCVRVNAAARNGILQVELLDPSGKVIPGFSREDCEALAAKDDLDFAIRFKGNKPLPKDPLRIRFVLFEAELFAFRTE